jgi:hypothetical protein
MGWLAPDQYLLFADFPIQYTIRYWPMAPISRMPSEGRIEQISGLPMNFCGE